VHTVVIGALKNSPPSGGKASSLMMDWPEYYYNTLTHAWRTMGPAEYGYVLVTIGIIGWALMKSTSR